MNSETSKLYDKLARNFDDYFNDPAHLEATKKLCEILEPIIKGKVLDLGCGNGFLLDNFKPDDYYGVDISVEMLGRLDQKHPKQKIMATTAEDFMGMVTGFDAIVGLNGSGSYFAPALFNELPKHLAKDGKVFIMFYKPDYYPSYYKRADKKRLDATAVGRSYLAFDYLTELGNYIIGSNYKIKE